MAIKAIGTVIENLGDGKTLKVHYKVYSEGQKVQRKYRQKGHSKTDFLSDLS